MGGDFEEVLITWMEKCFYLTNLIRKTQANMDNISATCD